VLIAKRLDKEIHFEWAGNASPDRRIAPPRYSIRWTGIIVIPPGGLRGMAVRADDGARLFIDGNLLLDFGRPSTRTSYVPISAGRHSIRVDYWNRLIHGDVSLLWLTGDSDASAQLVPGSPPESGSTCDDREFAHLPPGEGCGESPGRGGSDFPSPQPSPGGRGGKDGASSGEQLAGALTRLLIP
jgi:hypothetical protein